MDHNICARYKNVMLRPLVHEDIENLRVWRNDRQATRFLRQIGHITPEMQEKWFESYLRKQTELTFAIVETDMLYRIVGSVSLYDIADKQAEFGRIQVGDPNAHGRGIGKAATILTLAVAFERLKLERVYASVHRDNLAAYSSYMKVGFKVIGNRESEVGGVEDLIEIDRKTLYGVNDDVQSIVYSEYKG